MAFGTLPCASLAKSGDGVGFDQHDIRRRSGVAGVTPALASDGLTQQVLAARQVAMPWWADATGPSAPIQPLMPCLTLYLMA